MLGLFGRGKSCSMENKSFNQMESYGLSRTDRYIPPFCTWVDDKTSDCCTWEGVKCSNSTGRVIQLSLRAVYLHKFKFDVDDNFPDVSLYTPFEELQHLDLSNNALNWTIEVLTNLSNLEFLDLSWNNLDDFPDLRNMSKLKILNVSWNNFLGRIPPSILSLSSLEALSLRGTNIKDSISGFCELTKLQDLDLSGNKFEGILPPCLNNLTSLRMVDFSHNQLSGNIPSSLLSNLTSLDYISLSRNQFDQSSLSFMSLANHKNQLKVLGLSNCNLNTSTSDLLNFLHNQYDLREVDLSHNK
ncbi:hypothetical protein IFM89_024948 [Coptis chinensis]|uniref:Leucine-rich repeat-containing N-terminal plant-type domain-containing protein n=1 Tax=Coptis chinensis TaxID=261450 RepID=A0A835MC49_9MAGN|nr:hypothetical protein IFM89_024948 [Coptis chinensis]